MKYDTNKELLGFINPCSIELRVNTDKLNLYKQFDTNLIKDERFLELLFQLITYGTVDDGKKKN